MTLRIYFIVRKCSPCSNANTSYLQLYRCWICWVRTASYFVTWCSFLSCRGRVRIEYLWPPLDLRTVPAAGAPSAAVPVIAGIVVTLVDCDGAAFA